MVSVRKALNQYTLTNFSCYYSQPVYDNRVKYLQIPVYRTWQRLTASMQPQGSQNALDEVLDSIDGTYDFWFPFSTILFPKPDDVFFIPNVGYFAINLVDNWQVTGGDYVHVSATYRPSNIITDAGGEVDFSINPPALPIYNNPYPSGGMLDRVFSAHWECFDLLYGGNRPFYASDQDIRRFAKYSVLRFVDQDQIMHPLLTNSDGSETTLLSQQAESNYNAKVMLSFWGGQALADRNTWETMVFHDALMEIWDSYQVGITDDWYPENLTDTDQNRRLQKARTSYTVNVINTDSLEFAKTASVSLESLDVEEKLPGGSGV
jgi:hypothetical protein